MRGYRNFLVVIDHFTKYIQVIALADITAETAAVANSGNNSITIFLILFLFFIIKFNKNVELRDQLTRVKIKSYIKRVYLWLTVY